MRLYFKPGACSLSSRIVLHEVGATFDADQVDTKKGLTKAGKDYHAINPKGYVPALEVSDNFVLTENLAILLFLADTHPDVGLAPSCGTKERAKLHEWLKRMNT